MADAVTGAGSRRQRARSASGNVTTSSSPSTIAAGRTASSAARITAGAEKPLADIGASTTITPSRSRTLTGGSTSRIRSLRARASAAEAIHGDCTSCGEGTSAAAPANVTSTRRRSSPAGTPSAAAARSARSAAVTSAGPAAIRDPLRRVGAAASQPRRARTGGVDRRRRLPDPSAPAGDGRRLHAARVRRHAGANEPDAHVRRNGLQGFFVKRPALEI